MRGLPGIAHLCTMAAMVPYHGTNTVHTMAAMMYAAIALALAGVAGAETSASEWLAAIRAASPAIRDDVYAQLAQYQRLYGGHLYLYKPKEAQDLFYDDAGSRTRSRPTASTAAPASPRMTCSTRSSTRASGRPRRAAGYAHWHISLARG